MTDGLAQPPLTNHEVERRLPTLDLISDDDLREDVRAISRFAPPYFWERPGSTAGYHNSHDHGLWAHTLKLSTVISRLEDSLVQRERLSVGDIDRAHAAAILHDQRKAGGPAPPHDTRDDHDRLMARTVRQGLADSGQIADAVASHMGPWYEGPEPTTPLQEIVHTADMLAADDNISMAIQSPVPEELGAVGYEGVDLR
jgi:hypothetical protein